MMMKKAFLLLFILALALALAACGNGAMTEDEAAPESGPVIDYGESELYSQEDMAAAVALIQNEFAGWEGCELHSVTYAGDECVTDDNIEWMNKLKDGQSVDGPEFTQVIEFLSDFHSPVEGGGAWNADDEYTNWQWWLARSEGGDWQLLSWGY